MREQRETPLVGPIVLLVGFVALVIVGVFTVLIPELSDDGSDESGEPEAAETADP